MKQKLSALKGVKDKSISIRHQQSFSTNDRKYQKANNNVVNNTSNQKNLTDIYRTLHLTEYPYFLSIHDTWTSCCCLLVKPCPTLSDPMNCSKPGFPVLHYLLEFAPTYVHEAIQPSHPLSSASLPTLNLSQHQGLSHRANSSHQVAKEQEHELQNQVFQ